MNSAPTDPGPSAEPPSRPERSWQLSRILAGRRIATAESCTVGRIATRLAAEVGATEFLLGGIVAYHEVMNRQLLRVCAPCIYSEEAVRQMAERVCEITGADVAVATTGLAGPEPLDGIAPGTVCIGVRVAETTTTHTYRFDGTEDEIRATATEQAVSDLVRALLGSDDTRHDPRTGVG